MWRNHLSIPKLQQQPTRTQSNKPHDMCLYYKMDCRFISYAYLISPLNITVMSQWVTWRLKSPASGLFNQSFVYAYIMKNHISATLTFVRWIRRLPVDSLHKGPMMRNIFPFDDVIVKYNELSVYFHPELMMLSDVKFRWFFLCPSSTFLLLPSDK